MAFKTLQASVKVLLLLSVCSHVISVKKTAATFIREKCECVKEARAVQWRKITDFTIILKNPLCNKVQIKLQLSNKEVCLNPESKQGTKLQRCWQKINFNPQRKKVCLKIKKNAPKRPKKL
ncbi:chemokine (C-X-C motif) ligand 18a, duplicate 1 [Danio aesculapii]|uniref:chemokine (C-X-C motif) ligand 18a, duplicate 1 n=1 Tax=Danio aesculapii TaxID=1142201 RepID=UPI0024BF31D7|nr:chemokine (C-X-C motif) ligand 18a, duplicate 1 [Danio aesculapii]